MKAMTSRIEVPPDNAAALATFQCDDPHRIIGFAHLTKRELRSARSSAIATGIVEARGVVHSCTQAAPPSLGGLAKPSRSYYVPSGRRAGKLRQDASLAFLDVTALAFRISWRRPTA
jgi:hypothetical protein